MKIIAQFPLMMSLNYATEREAMALTPFSLGFIKEDLVPIMGGENDIQIIERASPAQHSM
jgi:hypothetical protein